MYISHNNFFFGRIEKGSNLKSVNNSNFYFATTSLDSVISDIEESITEGIQWGNNVGIAFTATLLAISLLAYLFNKNT